MRRLLILRPEPGASETVARARSRGLTAISIPLFEIERVNWRAPDPGEYDGLLLTSANAVRHAGDQLRNLGILKVYAVGTATADAARQSGLDVAAVGEAGVEKLLASIDGDLRLLHLCGEDRTIVHARQRITPVVVYRARQTGAPGLDRVTGGVALVHSPRAGRRLAELVEHRAPVAIAAISAAAAEAAGTGWEVVEIAERPTDDALLALAARLCDKPPPE